MTTDTRCESAGPSMRRAKSRQGFTLTEIAIVLGIIGLILGAIWVAAAAVYNNLRVSKTTTELLQIAQAVRSMYATSASVDVGANMGTTLTTIASPGVSGGAATYPAAGIFPADMMASTTTTKGKNTTTTFTVVDAWGGGAAINADQANTANDSFDVAFDAVPASACIILLTSVTGAGRDPGLWEVGTGAPKSAPSPSLSSFPLAASAAQKSCIQNDPGAIVFQFLVSGAG